MKFDVLHNFISPVTGRILCDPGKILVGDDAGIAQPSTVIPVGSLPDLTFNKIWLGDLFNRPVESGILDEFVAGPVESVIPLNLTIWDDSSGRHIRDSGYNVAGLAAIAAAANLAAASAADAAFAAAVASAAAVAAASAAFASAALAGGEGDTGAPGFGFPGSPGLVGAAGLSGQSTLFLDSNINVSGGRIEDIAPSPEADYDAVSAKWVWDLLNDNVEIKWE